MRKEKMEEEGKEESKKDNNKDNNIEQSLEKENSDAPESKALDNEISEADQIKELEEKLLRSAAEVENIRKRAEKERAEAYKIGISIFVRDFVPVLDNLQRALGSIKTAEEINYDSFVEGITATEKDITALLEKHGILQINPINEKFDPWLNSIFYNGQIRSWKMWEIM